MAGGLVEKTILEAALDCDDAKVRALLKGLLVNDLRNLARACDDVAEWALAEVFSRAE